MIIIIYLVIAYIALTSLQRKSGMFYLGTLSNYFFTKVFIALFLGWLIIPIWIITNLLGKSH